MHRIGNKTIDSNSSNQCGFVGCKTINYKVIAVFDKTLNNKEAFVIDHAEIDNIIQKMHIHGSCETITSVIGEELFKKITKDKKKSKLKALKVEIQPFDINFLPKAYMSYVKSPVKYFSFLTENTNI